MDPERILSDFAPDCEQEKQDRRRMLELLGEGHDLLHRDNESAHFTASSWIVSPDRRQVLMVYHNIYRSWSWIGGHADGERDLSKVAAKELREETGLAQAHLAQEGLLSCEILTVDGHMKRGAYVPPHLHLNATYLFEASESAALRIAPDENSGVRWLTFEEALAASTEPWMVEHVYQKLISRSK